MGKVSWAGLLLAALLLVAVLPVHAQTSSSDKTVKKVAQASRTADKKAEVASRVAERKGLLDEARVARIKLLGNRMLDRLQAAINRLRNILARIETRIAKIEAKGNKPAISAKALKPQIDKVTSQLEAAQASLDQARAELNAIGSSEKPKEAMETLIKSVAKVRDGIKAAHKAMVDLVVAIAKLEPKNATSSAEATSSASTSATVD